MMLASANAAQHWFIAGAIPLLVGGGGHALLTLVVAAADRRLRDGMFRDRGAGRRVRRAR